MWIYQQHAAGTSLNVEQIELLRRLLLDSIDSYAHQVQAVRLSYETCRDRVMKLRVEVM